MREESRFLIPEIPDANPSETNPPITTAITTSQYQSNISHDINLCTLQSFTYHYKFIKLCSSPAGGMLFGVSGLLLLLLLYKVADQS